MFCVSSCRLHSLHVWYWYLFLKFLFMSNILLRVLKIKLVFSIVVICVVCFFFLYDPSVRYLICFFSQLLSVLEQLFPEYFVYFFLYGLKIFFVIIVFSFILMLYFSVVSMFLSHCVFSFSRIWLYYLCFCIFYSTCLSFFVSDSLDASLGILWGTISIRLRISSRVLSWMNQRRIGHFGK